MNWWRRLVQRRQLEQQLERELSFHLEAHADDLLAAGQNAITARREATLALGGLEQVKELCRDVRGSRWIDNIVRDLRYAMRMYRRAPAFSLTALLTMALGIGATTAVFSVSDRILFRTLPYGSDQQLVSFGMMAKVVDDGEFLFAADYRDLSLANTPFQGITSWSGTRDCDITEQHPLRQHCAEVDFNFLSVLGVRPVLGDSFSQADARVGAAATVMLGYGVWQSHFGGNHNVIGKTLTLDGAPARIVGVLPRSFELPTLERADLLTPQIVLPAGWQHGATRVLRTIARLKPGTTLTSARLQLAPTFDRMLGFVPPQFRKEVQFRVRSIRDRQMGDFQLTAWALLGGALTLIMISFTNVANLFVARAATRQTELAIRRAIGISQGRMLCQMLTESLLLAIVGGAIGCLFGWFLLRLIVTADPSAIPHLADAFIDGRVLLVSLLLSIGAGVLFGVAPFYQRPRAGLLGVASRVSSQPSSTLKNSLVIAQIALSIVLLTSAGLLFRTLWNLEKQPIGLQTPQVLTAQLVLPSSRYVTLDQRIAFVNRVEQQIGSITGIQAVGISDSLPPGGWERSRTLFSIDVVGHPHQPSGTGGMIDWRYVSPGYFESLRIPVIQGRRFTEEDRRPGVNLCLLSQSLRLRLFARQNPVGQHLKFGTRPAYLIVGVVPDVKNTGLSTADNPEYYILRTHSVDDAYRNATGDTAQRMLSIVVRSSLPEAALATRIQREIATVDATLPVEILSMHQRLNEMAAAPRLNARLLIVFAGIGLFLAATGLYGTVSYLVAQRTREIGIRMSVGATPFAIAQLIIRQAVIWTLAGVALGIVLSLSSARLLSSLLFRVSARDPLTLIISIACLLTAVFLAITIPVRQAVTINPVNALRND